MNNKIHMPHSAGTPRSKSLEEVQAMIVQYENQIAHCENTVALSLITHKLNELKRLIQNKEVK